MVEVKPLKGITYNKQKIKHLDDVMSPPYDIISPELQDELYQKNPHNFVRLILGKQYEDDTEGNNRYTRSKKTFKNWLEKKILLPSNEPAIYPYSVEYKIDGSTKTMNGFFVLLKLDHSYKKVLAHEKTLSKPKADRLNLMRACHANLEPIQLLYIDETDEIQKQIQQAKKTEPFISVTGYDSFTHSIWKLTDNDVISMIQQRLKDEILFIADGHHRYQTALNFSDEMKNEKPSDDAPYNYRLVIVANMFDKGLAILPTHRLITLNNLDRDQFISRLESYFDIETYQISKEKTDVHLAETIKSQLKTDRQHKFALYFKDIYYILTLKNEDIMNALAEDRSETWKTLDVSILHKIIIEETLNITSQTLEDHVKYTRDDQEALSKVDQGEYEFSVLMNATKIDELKKIAEAGEHMPQKSTYFLPKMLSGLVMYKMDDL